MMLEKSDEYIFKRLVVLDKITGFFEFSYGLLRPWYRISPTNPMLWSDETIGLVQPNQCHTLHINAER